MAPSASAKPSCNGSFSEASMPMFMFLNVSRFSEAQRGELKVEELDYGIFPQTSFFPLERSSIVMIKSSF
jgi:hypothetical protein